MSQEQSQSSGVDVGLGHEQSIPADSLYTPTQVRIGAFSGGPIAAIYFLRQNFLALHKPAEAHKTVVWGAAFVVGLMILLLFLPDKFPRYVIPLAYSFGAGAVVNRWQLKKHAIQESGKYQIQSNWLVAGGSLILLVAFVAILAIEIVAFIGLGWDRA